jgi:hypothetical protein
MVLSSIFFPEKCISKEKSEQYNVYEDKVQTMMDNNFTNINKTNNHLSPQLTEHEKQP